MAKHLETGKDGERLAKSYLEDKGYRIEAENWRFSRAEVDLIAWDNAILVFVEVKTRTGDYMGAPSSFVTEKKERLMVDAASVYMENIGHEGELRFDIISVLIKGKHMELEHFEDAFFPGI